MAARGVKVRYIYHSGFLVETDRYLFVFDYYQGKIDSILKESAKPVVVFCSHSHPDHFNPEIFTWQKFKPDIQYVLSDDIQVPQTVKNSFFLSPYDTLELEDLKVKAYNSTDLGISFLIKTQGIQIFHAGDYNWWHWLDTPAEMADAEKRFKAELQKLKGGEGKIDIAFFPVDPRLEQNYSSGAENFIREISPRVFIPMHFADTPEITKIFRNKMQGAVCEILEIEEKGQEFIL